MTLVKTPNKSIVPSLTHASRNTPYNAGAKFDKPSLFGIGLIRYVHVQYSFALDGGAISTITPKNTFQLPANAIPLRVIVNPTTAPVGAGASVSIGTSAGSSTTSLLAATAITSLTLDAVVVGVATPFKTTASGNVTFTITGAALTAGVIEAWIEYVEAAAA